MGDVHPHALKARLARELSRITFERWSVAADVGRRKSRARGSVRRVATAATGKVIFCNSGFEAVEAALKTAILATGKPGVLAFTGAYHGTGYGTLNATHRSLFREPFLAQLGQFAAFLPYPTGRGELDRLADQIRRRLARSAVGALLVEPVQGRGGIRVPPPGFLPLLRELCDESGALLILDEVYTGFGRTGRWFGCDHSGTVPDVLCLGKALTGGFPLSACVGKAEVMDAAWPPAAGEAIHTSTFLGHPVGCAMALAQIGEIARRHLVERSQRLGDRLRADLASLRLRRGRLRLSARGLGLMVGLELRQPDGAPATQAALRLVKVMLRRGYLLLPEGAQGEVISFTPPLTITARELQQTVAVLAEELGQLFAP
jgi:4-aminobutyrate aminotransferase-like enzyme